MAETQVSIRWRNDSDITPPEDIKVAGEFNSWIPECLVKREDGSWVGKFSLKPGKYQFKYVVDGEWVVNKDQPLVKTPEGVENNQIEVDEESEGSGADSDSWEKVSIPEEKEMGGEKITVIDRLFSVNLEVTEHLLRENEGKLIEETTGVDVYKDTNEFHLLRKGIWLREKKNENGGESWQLRRLVENDLKVVDDADEIIKSLTSLVDETKSDLSLKELTGDWTEIARFENKVSKWQLGTIEIELKKEGEVETALVRVVGDISTSLKELETTSNKLKLANFLAAKVLAY